MAPFAQCRGLLLAGLCTTLEFAVAARRKSSGDTDNIGIGMDQTVGSGISESIVSPASGDPAKISSGMDHHVQGVSPEKILSAAIRLTREAIAASAILTSAIDWNFDSLGTIALINLSPSEEPLHVDWIEHLGWEWRRHEVVPIDEGKRFGSSMFTVEDCCDFDGSKTNIWDSSPGCEWPKMNWRFEKETWVYKGRCELQLIDGSSGEGAERYCSHFTEHTRHKCMMSLACALIDLYWNEPTDFSSREQSSSIHGLHDGRAECPDDWAVVPGSDTVILKARPGFHHEGKDCWKMGNCTTGPCAFCGTEGLCCRQPTYFSPEYGDNGCGDKGYYLHHGCVPK